MRIFFKRLLYLILLILLIALIYTSLPRVWYKTSSYGTELTYLNNLPDTTKISLTKYIHDPEQHYAKGQQVVILHDEKIIFEIGDTKELINCHSARKSIMSVLFGIAKEKGFLALNETLAELGLDESKTPLTKQEKSATIRDLLMARSGVYLPAELKQILPKLIDLKENNTNQVNSSFTTTLILIY